MGTKVGDRPQAAAEQVLVPPKVVTFIQSDGSISVNSTWVE